MSFLQTLKTQLKKLYHYYSDEKVPYLTTTPILLLQEGNLSQFLGYSDRNKTRLCRGEVQLRKRKAS